MNKTELIVKNVQKWLGSLQVLKGVDFTAESGSIVALLGGSGSGKTTLLRCIAGLENPETGFIQIGNSVARDAEKNIQLPPEKRNVGLVFQSYALWPHRTVYQNVSYGLKLRNISKEDIKIRTDKILKTMGLDQLADRYPSQLSGGQQQRVSICRAVIYEPRVLLLDEPLSNLDAKLREEARYWIRKLILELNICAILVTHDQTEALAVADNILLLQNGQIIQQGTPHEIYSNPTHFYTAEFLGSNNIAHGKILEIKDQTITFGGEGWQLTGVSRNQDKKLNVHNDVKAIIRVENIDVTTTKQKNAVEMQLDASFYLGDHWEYRMHLDNLEIKATGSHKLDQGAIFVTIKPEDIWVFGVNS